MLVSNKYTMSSFVDRSSKKIGKEVLQKYVYLVYLMDVIKKWKTDT
jgi:hypothetical protein